MTRLSVRFARERMSRHSLLPTASFLAMLIAATLAGASLIAQKAAAEPSPESVGISTRRLGRLDHNLQGYVERGEVAGVVALIARRGKVIYHRSFGKRHIEGRATMTRDTIFRIASMTKPIVSVALMQLWEQGRFQLRAPISGGSPSTVVDTQVQLIDLMPTLLEWLQIRIPAECQGASLVPLLEGRAAPGFNDYVFSSGGTGGPRRELCIRSSEWKLLRFRNIDDPWGRRDELFHLGDDPGERRNLFQERQDVAAPLGEKLDAWEREVQAAALAEELVDPAVGKIMRERMRERGYWWLETEKPQRRGGEAQP